MNNKQYRPKGSMCMSCSKLYNDCKGLEFSNMKVFKHGDGGIDMVVICDEFKKSK